MSYTQALPLHEQYVAVPCRGACQIHLGVGSGPVRRPHSTCYPTAHDTTQHHDPTALKTSQPMRNAQQSSRHTKLHSIEDSAAHEASQQLSQPTRVHSIEDPTAHETAQQLSQHTRLHSIGGPTAHENCTAIEPAREAPQHCRPHSTPAPKPGRFRSWVCRQGWAKSQDQTCCAEGHAQGPPCQHRA